MISTTSGPKGTAFKPCPARLSPAAVVDLVEAYRAGATISQLAVEFGIHRTTVTGHLDRHGVPRHSEQTAWDDEILKNAAELYAAGLSLADVAHRPRRGWTSRVHSEQERR